MSAVYRSRAEQTRAVITSHLKAIQVHKQALRPSRDWGTHGNRPPSAWAKVDASAAAHGVAVTYHPPFDAASISASLELVAYVGTSDSALAQIAALAAQQKVQMACDIALRYMGEHLPDKRKTTAQARAALLGGSILVTPHGYRLTLGNRVALVQEWRCVEAILNEMEAANG